MIKVKIAVILPRATATAAPAEAAGPGALRTTPSPLLCLGHLVSGGYGRGVPRRRLVGRLSHDLIRCLNKHGTKFGCCGKKHKRDLVWLKTDYQK